MSQDNIRYYTIAVRGENFEFVNYNVLSKHQKQLQEFVSGRTGHIKEEDFKEWCSDNDIDLVFITTIRDYKVGKMSI
jgi:hypothetical protein